MVEEIYTKPYKRRRVKDKGTGSEFEWQLSYKGVALTPIERELVDTVNELIQEFRIHKNTHKFMKKVGLEKNEN